MKTSANEIGKRIKKLRKEEDLTQTEFGEKIGVKGNTITGYENGTRRPSDSILNYICLIFNVDQTWLRTGEGEMYMSTPDCRDALEKLLSDKDCNNMEIKFLTSYFQLKENERKAFCELIVKMFPDAISKIVGDDPLGKPYSFNWQEVLPLSEIEEGVASGTPSGVVDAESAYEKSLGFARNMDSSALNTIGDTASFNGKVKEKNTTESGGGEGGNNVG